MNQRYLNSPSTGRAIPAEEFAAGAFRSSQPYPSSASGCGCTTAASTLSTGCGCGTSDCPADDCGQEHCQQMVCCCRPVSTPPQEPPLIDESCCCKESFRAALGLLCDQQISSLLDFDTAAFITNTYTAGATLTGGKPSGGNTMESQADSEAGDDAKAAGKPNPPTPPTPPNPNGPSDNLGTLTGSFRRFAPCNCDLLDIDAELYTAGGKKCAFSASQVSLCQLDAVVIQGASACAGGDMNADEVTARNFRCLRQRLAQRLSPCGSPCGQEQCSCACDGRDCCCAAGLLATLAQNNLSRRVSLVAGLLILQGVTLLGTVGSVLVLSNDADNRLYFVCVNSVQFIG